MNRGSGGEQRSESEKTLFTDVVSQHFYSKAQTRPHLCTTLQEGAALSDLMVNAALHVT